MQADGRLPVEGEQILSASNMFFVFSVARRNYTGILNALSRIIREEGMHTNLLFQI
jgi:hypothetical protein